MNAIIRAGDHRRMRWANGGGWTTEIVAFPHRDAWEWRLSVADVAGDGPFSGFPGIDRTIALLTGAGFALTIDGNSEHVIDEPYRPVRFDGAADTTCRLLDGRVQDLNLMVRRGTPELTLTFISVEPARRMAISGAIMLVIDGVVTVGSDRLDRLDAIHVCVDTSVMSASDQPASVAVISPWPSHPA